jgi:hypothetical protein
MDGPSPRNLEPSMKKRKASLGTKPGESEPTAASCSREPLAGGTSSAAAAAAMLDTAVATTKGSTESPSVCPPKASSDGDPPDSRRYWPLWTEYRNGAAEAEDILPARSESTQAKQQQQRKEGDSTMWTAADEAQWKDEKELFAYNLFMRDKIEACRRQIDQYKHDIEDIRQKCHQDMEVVRHKIRGCEIEMEEMGLQVDRATVIPRLLRSDRAFWEDGQVPEHVRCDAELAWLLIRSSKEALPVPFQRMLWTDPNCPLRSDRALLLASLENKFLSRSVKIVWSQEMANDRELVMKCFDRCPRSVRASTAGRAAGDDSDDEGSGDDDDGAAAEIRATALVEGCELPDAYFGDMEMLQAYAFPACDDGRRYYYRMSEYRYHSRGFHTRFSPALLLDPRLLVDLLVLVCTSKDDQTAWARSVMRKAFPNGTRPERHPLLDSEEFALLLARATAGIPDDESRRRLKVTYEDLSDRVRAIPEVALAFVRADGHNVYYVPDGLSSDAELWTRIYTAATDTYPYAIFCRYFHPEMSPEVMGSKDLLLRVIATAMLPERGNPRLYPWAHKDLSKAIPAFPPAIRQDREVNMQLVLLSMEKCLTDLHQHYDPGCIQDPSFWIELAERHRCPYSARTSMPAQISTDAAVALKWLRHSYPDVCIEWLCRDDEKFPELHLMSDRQVLINWIPKLSYWMHRDDSRANALYGRIPPACLDKALWMELFTRGGACSDVSCAMPESLGHDPDLVDAQLRSCLAARNEYFFLKRFNALPPLLQLQFSCRLVEAIQLANESFFELPLGIRRSTWEREQAPEMWKVPDVALAAIAKGWIPTSETVEASPWSHDPAFLISVAKVRPKNVAGNCDYVFWRCCSDALRRDQAFILEVMRLDRADVPRLELDDAMKNDFDVMRVKHARASEYDFSEPTQRDLEFIGNVRDRLELSLSLEVFMRGIRSSHFAPALVPPGPTCALTILNQDGYTLAALQRRLVEYLGSPSREEVAELRIVSRKFTKFGY